MTQQQLRKWIDKGEGEESSEELQATTPVKKMITLIIMILLWCNAFSQGYLSTSILNKGIAANIGFLTDKTDINFGVQLPLTDKTIPTIYHIEVGRMINLTHNDGGNDYSITPSIGAALSNKKEVVPANTFREEYGKIFPYESLKTVTNTSAYYSLELGKDAYLGRVFLKTVYCGNIYYSVGMRLFLNRNL